MSGLTKDTGSGILPELEKCPTGIEGFDELSEGGLPRGRPTLVAGQAGTGKTLFALEFLRNGIERYGEAGVFVSFEEDPEDLAANVASLGFDLVRHQAESRLRVLHFPVDAEEFVEAGEYNLDGLFLFLGQAVAATGAKRIALDGVENLFAAFSGQRILRAEFRRLLAWLRERGLTAMVTTERGTNSITRDGIEEYIADCVIVLDNRVENQLATRRLRVVKYRGSSHSGDECPFVLDRTGFSVIPVTSAGLDYPVSSERLSSGIADLDAMLGGGVFRGSSLLVSGTSGTGKSSLAARLAEAAVGRGERCLYMALEESPDQIARNMASIGIDLAAGRAGGLLRFHAARPTSGGLESHLATLANLVRGFNPRLVVIDPITAFDLSTDDERVKLMLVRAGDLFKSKGITSLFTALTQGTEAPESTSIGISSLVDVWILLRNLELAGERTRGLYILKARGMAHSNQIREFRLSESGIKLVEVLLDADGRVLTGSARSFHENQKASEAEERRAEEERRHATLDTRRRVIEAKIAALRAEYEEELESLEAESQRQGTLVRRADRAFAELATRRSDFGPAEAARKGTP